MNGFEKQVKQLLKQHGWSFHRAGTGSHEIWCKGRKAVTVNDTCKSRHTANAIMKQAGIDHKF